MWLPVTKRRSKARDIAQEIEQYAGTQFDPEVANAFLSLYEEGAFDNLRDDNEDN